MGEEHGCGSRKLSIVLIKKQPFVDPGDYLLLFAGWKANILIKMPGKAGMAGVSAMHDWFVSNGINAVQTYKASTVRVLSRWTVQLMST
jgi:hypothetical protein